MLSINVQFPVEPERGIEPLTPSLPRKCSTPELLWHQKVSGRRNSNPRPSAWKADALPTELLPLNIVSENRNILLFRHYIIFPVLSGESRIRTYEGICQQIYSLPQLAALVSPQKNRTSLSRHTFTTPSRADEGIRTPDLQITNQLL